MSDTNSNQRECSDIRCENVSVKFGASVMAIDDVSISVPAGKIVSLVGPSGCGKTTLLRCFANLQTPTSGKISIDPPCVANNGEIAFVFQQPALLPWRTAAGNVSLPLELAGYEGDAIAESLRVLDAVRLGDSANQFPDQLSGGMKMRVSIARALVTRPRVLLLDEPFAALDELLRNDLGQLLLELWKAYGFTVVMVTHNISEAILLSHEVAVMGGGKIDSIVSNPLPWPRASEQLRTAQFGEIYGQISDIMSMHNASAVASGSGESS